MRFVDQQDFKEQRHYQRVVLRNPIHVQFKDPKTSNSGLTQNISQGGLQFEISQFIPLGEEIEAQIVLGPQRVIDCQTRVVWVERMPYSEWYKVGLEFLDTSSTQESRRDLFDYVHKRDQ